jgi:ornithine cyclodeaminase/alanine dehydrogenase-like protein (mu-crystallin family)
MPATDGRIAITKLISFTPANATQDRAIIKGDVVVFDVKTGERIAILDGPTIIARRTATDEAGDLIQAGLDIAIFPTLAQIVRGETSAKRTGSILFKSCGWAGWDLAAARLVIGVGISTV